MQVSYQTFPGSMYIKVGESFAAWRDAASTIDHMVETLRIARRPLQIARAIAASHEPLTSRCAKERVGNWSPGTPAENGRARVSHACVARLDVTRPVRLR